MPWFTFSQNNSFGVIKGPDYLIVEATTYKEANEVAEKNGAYFDGIAEGLDCGCCGDRWYPTYKEAATEEPLIYGESPGQHRPTFEKEEIHVVPLSGPTRVVVKER